MAKLSVTDLDLDGELVLARVDYNVPLVEGGVGDDERIRATVPTLRYLAQKGARTVLCAHLGRPKGKPDLKYSLRPVAMRLAAVLRENGIAAEVGFCPETVGSEAEAMAARLDPGHFLLVENLRFQAGEEKNDPEFARQLGNLGEVYVNDAFGAAHRAHASTAGVTKSFPQAAAGFLMQRELEYLGKVRSGGEHPFLVILGGAKVSDKLPVIRSLVQRADRLLIGGGMSYTFLKAQGKPIGDSLVEADYVEEAGKLLRETRPGQIVLPDDHVIAPAIRGARGAAALGPAPTFDAGAEARVVTEIPDGMKALDIGPATRKRYAEEIARARLLFWNGPMGVFEHPPFDAGTLAVAKAVAACGGITVAGGGDSVAALNATGLAGKLTHVSTGGGASLEFLAGDALPGVEALTDRD